MLKTVSTALVTLGLLAGSAIADEVDDAIEKFVSSDGFERQNPDAVDERLFPFYNAKPGAMRPDSAVNVFEKALLVPVAMDSELPRVRYMLRYGQMIQDDTPVSFVTVERYNLGPAIRKSVIEDYGAENVDEPEAFGVGPHVAWRIVSMPMMGAESSFIEVARREISEDEAARADCAGQPCLALDTMIDDLQTWEEFDPGINLSKQVAVKDERGTASPSLAIAELLLAAGLTAESSGEVHWSGIEHPEAARGSDPFIFVRVDQDLGQEVNVDTILGQTLLNDDSIAELWYRRNAFMGMDDVPSYWLRATVGRKR